MLPIRSRSIRIFTLFFVALIGSLPLAAQDKAKAIDALLSSYYDVGVFNGIALVRSPTPGIFR